jgi:hypothetical protein
VLSPLHVLAQVRWRARFEKTGARAIEFEIACLVERAGILARARIHFRARSTEGNTGVRVDLKIADSHAALASFTSRSPSVGRAAHRRCDAKNESTFS